MIVKLSTCAYQGRDCKQSFEARKLGTPRLVRFTQLEYNLSIYVFFPEVCTCFLSSNAGFSPHWCFNSEQKTKGREWEEMLAKEKKRKSSPRIKQTPKKPNERELGSIQAVNDPVLTTQHGEKAVKIFCALSVWIHPTF